jgi:redox-sensitive bicupin YhaK (pirin superfamily)
VPTRSPTLYLDLALESSASIELAGALAHERALYAVDAAVTIDAQPVAAHTLAVLPAGRSMRLSSSPDQPARCVLIGGEPLGQRFMWWNFVSSRKHRIVQAADEWAAQPNDAFPRVPGESEFIALPQKRP